MITGMFTDVFMRQGYSIQVSSVDIVHIGRCMDVVLPAVCPTFICAYGCDYPTLAAEPALHVGFVGT